MKELPKIVRQRLAHRAKHDSASAPDALRGAVHPDANMLSAFAERSLSDDERAAVLGHLAECAECRELVHLAFPAPEVQAELSAASAPAESSRHFPVRPIWLGWRTLRWGVLAASVAVVMASAFRAGILKWPAAPNKARNTVAEVRPAPSMIASPPAASPAPSTQSNAITSAPSAYTRGMRALRDKVADEEAARSESALQRREPAGGVAKEAEKSPAPASIPPQRPAEERQHRAQYALKAAPAPNDVNKDRSTLVANAATAYGRAAASVSGNERAVPSRPGAPIGGVAKNAPERELDQKSLRSSEAIEAQARVVAPEKKVDQLKEQSSTHNAQASSLGQAMAPPPQAPAVPVREQSEQGVASGLLPQQTTQEVTATQQQAGAAVARKAAKGRGANLPAYWSISASGRIERSQADGGPWSELHVDDSIKFQAVTAEGNDVWAGGSGGALYHSTDGGAHWTGVKVGPNRPDDQAFITDAIVSVRFSDPQHGQVVTDAHETWTTTDGGAHWSLAQ